MLELSQQMAEQLDTRVFQTKIRNSVSVAGGPGSRISIVDYSPHSKPSQDYECLCVIWPAPPFPGGPIRMGPGGCVMAEKQPSSKTAHV